jgi:hypothetical protein
MGDMAWSRWREMALLNYTIFNLSVIMDFRTKYNNIIIEKLLCETLIGLLHNWVNWNKFLIHGHVEFLHHFVFFG